MCVPSFNLLCLTVPEKSVTKIFNVWKLERKKNEEIKGWIRAAAWFPYTRYTHPVSMCVPSFNLLGLTVPEKSVTKNFHCCCSFLPLFSFHSLQFSNILKCLSPFSQELWGPEVWDLVHTWTMGGCIMYTGIRLLLLICPFISSVFFLSNYQTLTIFVTLFSGTMRPRKLKLGTPVDNGCMYCVYMN